MLLLVKGLDLAHAAVLFFLLFSVLGCVYTIAFDIYSSRRVRENSLLTGCASGSHMEMRDSQSGLPRLSVNCMLIVISVQVLAEIQLLTGKLSTSYVFKPPLQDN